MNLFVYGTLKTGGANGALLGRCKRFPAKAEGRLYRMPTGVPALVVQPDAGWVEGEFVEAVPPEVVALCDLYDGVAEGLYERVAAEVVIGLRRHPVQLYAMSDAEARGGVHLPSGRWNHVVRRGRR